MEEVKPLFNVGDSPQWTKELIKALPHGTVLKCAYYKVNTDFTYEGQELLIGCDSIKVLFNDLEYHFRSPESGGVCAKILSLPEETAVKIDNYFNTNDSKQLKKDWEESEAQPGDMVQVKMDDWEYFDSMPEEYVTTLKRNEHKIHITINNNLWKFRNEIRKIRPNPDKEIDDMVDEVLRNTRWRCTISKDVTYIQIEDVKSMLVEVIKKERGL